MSRCHAQVARDAEVLLLQLLGMVKQSALASLPGSVAIVAVKAVGTLAAQRPQYLGRVLPTLLSAATAKGTATVRLSCSVHNSQNRRPEQGLRQINKYQTVPQAYETACLRLSAGLQRMVSDTFSPT